MLKTAVIQTVYNYCGFLYQCFAIISTVFRLCYAGKSIGNRYQSWSIKHHHI